MTLTSNDGMGALPKHDDSTDMLREWDVAVEQTCHFSEDAVPVRLRPLRQNYENKNQSGLR